MTNSAAPVFRFAPSPNGELHLGHAFSALLNLELARLSGGKMLLRIEDIDTVRCTPQLESEMLKDLEWIGFEWDESPLRQSEHLEVYRAVVSIFDRMEVLYPATLSRGEIRDLVEKLEKEHGPWPRDPDGSPLYPGDERDLEREEQDKLFGSETPYAIRLNTRKAEAEIGGPLTWLEVTGGEPQPCSANPSRWGDVILARKDTPASYHLCCVVDDALQGITHVVRGEDLRQSTSIHRLLQELLDLPAPVYYHHPLLTDAGGRKLSKSDHDTSLRQLREAGLTAEDIRQMILENRLRSDR